MAREVGRLNSEIQGVSNETSNPLDNDSQNGIACYSPQCPKATSKLSQKSGWNGRLTLKHYSLQSYYAEIHGLRSEIAIAVANSVNCNPYFLESHWYPVYLNTFRAFEECDPRFIICPQFTLSKEYPIASVYPNVEGDPGQQDSQEAASVADTRFRDPREPPSGKGRSSGRDILEPTCGHPRSFAA